MTTKEEAIHLIKVILKDEGISIEIMEDRSIKLDRAPESYVFGRAIGRIDMLIYLFNIKQEDIMPL